MLWCRLSHPLGRHLHARLHAANLLHDLFAWCLATTVSRSLPSCKAKDKRESNCK